MTELKIELEEINLQDFYGANNTNLKQLKKHFPKLKIIGRDKILHAVGNETDLEELQQKISRILQHLTYYNKLDLSDINQILNDTIQKPLKGEVLLHGVSGRLIKVENPGQKELVQTIEKNDLIFAIGPAGTGKTYTSVAMAVKALKNKKIRKIILTRPAVEAGENLGFLPGDLKEKIDPYMQPLYDALRDMIHHEKLNFYMEKMIIEIAPLAFMRGRTLDHAFVILDEAQNTTHAQMRMFLTRMGRHAKFVVNGDLNQIDLPRNQSSGLNSAINILKDIPNIGQVKLDKSDILRHKLVQDVVNAYEKSYPNKQEN